MTPQTKTPTPKVKEPTFAEWSAEQQKLQMSNVRLMLINFLAYEPPVSGWPLEVRKYMYKSLTRAATLFAPQTEEEAAEYEE